MPYFDKACRASENTNNDLKCSAILLLMSIFNRHSVILESTMYTTCKIHINLHPGLKWHIFHILTSEDHFVPLHCLAARFFQRPAERWRAIGLFLPLRHKIFTSCHHHVTSSIYYTLLGMRYKYKYNLFTVRCTGSGCRRLMIKVTDYKIHLQSLKFLNLNY